MASTAIQLSVKSEHGGPWAHGLRAPIFVPTMSSTHLLCGGHSRKVFVWQLGDSNESDREPDSRLSLGTITESSCLGACTSHTMLRRVTNACTVSQQGCRSQN